MPGQIVHFEIPSSTCKDPHGNEFGLWQNDPAAPAEER